MNPFQPFIKQADEQHLWEKTLTLNRNDFLKIGETTDTNVYYVVGGCLRIFVLDEVEEHTIRFGYQGNIIAALDSFLTGKPSDLYIQALRKTELKIISKPTFNTLVAASIENRVYWQQTLEALVVQQMERELDLLISSPIERYLRVMKRSPHLFQEVPHKYIASYLRMTPETLSRVKKS